MSCSAAELFQFIQAVMVKSPSAKCSSGKALELILITSPLPSKCSAFPTMEPVECMPRLFAEPDILVGFPLNEPELLFPELSKHNVPSPSSNAH